MLAKLLRNLFGAKITKTRKPSGLDKPLRGSGSWDMAYEAGQKAKPLPKPDASKAPEKIEWEPREKYEVVSKPAPMPEEEAAPSPPPRVAVHAVRLLDVADMGLYNVLCDRLEAEVPDVLLFAEVALSAFLRVDRRAPEEARQAMMQSFSSDRVTFLLVNGSGQPLLALDHAGPDLEVKRRVLDEAGLSLVDIRDTPTDALWLEILDQLDLDDDVP